MGREKHDDIFGHAAWQIAGGALEFAQESVLLEADVQVSLNDGVTNIPGSTNLVRGQTVIDLDPPVGDDSEGLYWVSMLGLRSAMASSVEFRLRQAYLLGRLDQIASSSNTNAERFVKSKELGRVVREAMEFEDMTADTPHDSEIDAKASRILAKARNDQQNLI